MTTWRFVDADGAEHETAFDACTVGAAGELHLGGLMLDGQAHTLRIIAPGQWVEARYDVPTRATELPPEPPVAAPVISLEEVRAAMEVAEELATGPLERPAKPQTDVARGALALPKQCRHVVKGFHCARDAQMDSDYCDRHGSPVIEQLPACLWCGAWPADTCPADLNVGERCPMGK